MRLSIKVIALFFVTVCAMTSCLNSDSEVTLYDDTAITSFTLGTLNCYQHTISSKGTDSTYLVTYAGSSFPVYIDQLNKTIYNVDSLPKGTDLKHVVVTINTKNNGIAALKSLNSDSIAIISSTDSIDFSETRDIRVFSNSSIYSRDYKVTLVAHNEVEDVFTWSNIAVNSAIASFSALSTMEFKDYIYVIGKKNGASMVMKTSTGNGKEWDEVQIPAQLSADASMVADGSMIYVADAETIYASADGNAWTSVPAAGVKTLVGACGKELYAIDKEGNMMMSLNQGKNWTVEPIDSDKSLLPAENINCIAWQTNTNKDVKKAIIVGNRDEKAYSSDKAVMIWSKIVEEDAERDQSWSYYDVAYKNDFLLPCMENMTVINYDNSLFAIGGKGVNGSNVSAYSKVYRSLDNGLTWHENSRITLPGSFSASNAAMTVDKNNFIWLICAGNGEVWKGRLSQLGWDINQKYYDK